MDAGLFIGIEGDASKVESEIEAAAALGCSREASQESAWKWAVKTRKIMEGMFFFFFGALPGERKWMTFLFIYLFFNCAGSARSNSPIPVWNLFRPTCFLSLLLFLTRKKKKRTKLFALASQIVQSAPMRKKVSLIGLHRSFPRCNW